MPRMPNYLKREWAFFLDERGRKKYSHIIEENKVRASECIADVLLRKKA